MTNQNQKKSLKKSLIIATIILIAVPLAVISFFSLPWVAMGVGIWLFTPNPPKPEVKYGEFPFEVVYKIDGEEFKVKDIYICEYDGIGANEGVGKYRQWKGYIKSTGEEEIFLKKEENTEFFLNVGSPEYYMNDRDGETDTFTPFIGTITTEELSSGHPIYRHSTLPLDLASYHHGIDIISIEISDPIENSFK